MTKSLHPLLAARLKKHLPRTAQALLLAIREMVQEIALLGLARVGFFKQAAFHGGTALRVLHNLDRFSEDLDFCLRAPDSHYALSSILTPLRDEMESWGLKVEIVERSKLDNMVKKAFLKETSLGALLSLEAPIHRQQKCTIKLEIDSNPPAGATLESKLCEFPTDHYVTCHDLPSMFAGKLHALLTREYVKGRDWYDLLFYLSQRCPINFLLLKNALLQRRAAQFKDLPEALSREWVRDALHLRLSALDMEAVISDVRPFVADSSSLKIWSQAYFDDKIERYCKS